jgi:hypothetical protein
MPKFLQEKGYNYRYTLEQALAEWRDERPDEWTKLKDEHVRNNR